MGGPKEEPKGLFEMAVESLRKQGMTTEEIQQRMDERRKWAESKRAGGGRRRDA